MGRSNMRFAHFSMIVRARSKIKSLYSKKIPIGGQTEQGSRGPLSRRPLFHDWISCRRGTRLLHKNFLPETRNGGRSPFLPDAYPLTSQRHARTVSGRETRRAPPARRLDPRTGPPRCDRDRRPCLAAPRRTCYSQSRLLGRGARSSCRPGTSRWARIASPLARDRHRQHQRPSAGDRTGAEAARHHAGVSSAGGGRARSNRPPPRGGCERLTAARPFDPT